MGWGPEICVSFGFAIRDRLEIEQFLTPDDDARVNSRILYVANDCRG